MCTADLSQGNDMIEVLQYNANHRCHSCEVTQEMLNDPYFDIQANGRYCHIANFHF